MYYSEVAAKRGCAVDEVYALLDESSAAAISAGQEPTVNLAALSLGPTKEEKKEAKVHPLEAVRLGPIAGGGGTAYAIPITYIPPPGPCTPPVSAKKVPTPEEIAAAEQRLKDHLRRVQEAEKAASARLKGEPGVERLSCPYCRGAFEWEQGQLNCGVFLHLSIKGSKDFLSPHLPAEQVAALEATGVVRGCGGRFEVRKNEKGENVIVKA